MKKKSIVFLTAMFVFFTLCVVSDIKIVSGFSFGKTKAIKNKIPELDKKVQEDPSSGGSSSTGYGQPATFVWKLQSNGSNVVGEKVFVRGDFARAGELVFAMAGQDPTKGFAYVGGDVAFKIGLPESPTVKTYTIGESGAGLVYRQYTNLITSRWGGVGGGYATGTVVITEVTANSVKGTFSVSGMQDYMENTPLMPPSYGSFSIGP